jgi:hypothetical protein
MTLCTWISCESHEENTGRDVCMYLLHDDNIGSNPTVEDLGELSVGNDIITEVKRDLDRLRCYKGRVVVPLDNTTTWKL